MDPLLQLISDLYAQLAQATARNRELEAALVAKPGARAASEAE